MSDQGPGLRIIRAKSLEEQKREAALAGGRFTVSEHLFRTPDGAIVPERGLTGSGVLLYRPGDDIPVAEAERLGLIPPAAEAPSAATEPEVEPAPQAKRRRER